MDTDRGREIMHKNHYSFLSEVSKDYILIKSGPKLNDKLRRLFAEHAKLNIINEE